MYGASALMFVSLGTHNQSMEYLARVLGSAASRLPHLGPFRIQHGSTPLPIGWTGEPYFSPERMAEEIRQADIVVTHGGPATIALARTAGKIPIVVPRSRARREHVDDHQLAYARRLAAGGEVVLVEDPDTLIDTLAQFTSILLTLPVPSAHDATPAIERFVAIVSELDS